MPLLARRLNATVYYSPQPCLPFLLPKALKTILVVHDVVNIEYKDTMQWTNILSNLLFFNRSVRNADIIWTNSIYTKHKVEHYFPTRHCHDIFTGCAIDRAIYQPLQLSEEDAVAIKKQFGINDRFILFVGSLEPRKNLSFLLSLMPDLYKKQHLQLVVIGGNGWKNSSISQQVEASGFPKESTIFCGFVNNQQLAQLYNLATCFVSASLNEGFGMPQLEALLCGCPIITAHNSAMIEVASGKDGAITIEGYDPQTWINAITRVVNERPVVNTSQLAAYDWNIILKKFLENKL
jgi:glycosyltransferase involved in cell wall biosynthesis